MELGPVNCANPKSANEALLCDNLSPNTVNGLLLFEALTSRFNLGSPFPRVSVIEAEAASIFALLTPILGFALSAKRTASEKLICCDELDHANDVKKMHTKMLMNITDDRRIAFLIKNTNIPNYLTNLLFSAN